MPKRIAIVDIGSNSTRVVIFQRTSRFGFHLVAQQKADVRISKGSFEANGILQEEAICRSIASLKLFNKIIKEYKARKTLIVATAAVRNAPNRYEFIKRVKEETGFKIRVIDGEKEAFYGAISANNLLPIDKDSITVDIGGGSTDIALIQNKKITNTISLNIGTVTLKELFFDKNRPIEEAINYIKNELNRLDQCFKAKKAIAIGGVLRALTKSIMEIENYSYKKIHSFNYSINNYQEHINSIIKSNNKEELNSLNIKENRHDTIKGGILIFRELLSHLDITNIITSSVGVREGIFLNDMLRGSGGKFPKELNPSIISIKDRLDLLKIDTKTTEKIAIDIYSHLKENFDPNSNYLNELLDAIKLSNVGKSLTIYDEHKHTYYIAMQELNWQYNHKQMLLISAILRSKGEKLIYKAIKKEHKKLLPSKNSLKWLGLIYTISNLLHTYTSKGNLSFKYTNNILSIHSNYSLDLFKEEIKDLKLPKNIYIDIVQN